jgi:hypothetical protein
MDSFEYLIALVSVIAGLGITRALSGMARLLDAHRKISFSWVPICWTASVLLWLVAFWWFTFLLSSFEGWSLGLHIFVLIYAGAIFFLLALLHPESIGEGYDMMEHFLENRRLFFGALLTLALIDIADTWIKFRIGLNLPPLVSYSALMLSWITMSAAAMIVRKRAYHVLFALLFFVAIALWLTYNISNILAIVSVDAK